MYNMRKQKCKYATQKEKEPSSCRVMPCSIKCTIKYF